MPLRYTRVRGCKRIQPGLGNGLGDHRVPGCRVEGSGSSSLRLGLLCLGFRVFSGDTNVNSPRKDRDTAVAY